MSLIVFLVYSSGTYAMTSSADAVCLWQVDKWQRVRTLTPGNEAASSKSKPTSGAIITQVPCVYINRNRSGRCYVNTHRPVFDVYTVQAHFFPAGDRLMTCFGNNSLLVWDLANMRMLYKLAPPDQLLKQPAMVSMRTCAVSGDQRYVVAAGG